LGRKKVIVTKIPYEWRQKFLGGRGISAYLLFSNLPIRSDPLGPDSIIIISTGLIAGAGSGPFACTGITAKSPLTGLSVFSPLTGHFAREMQSAGFDHLVITGKATTPIYLYIHDEIIEFKTAENLKGKTISETFAGIRKDLMDENVRALMIGPAGENRVFFADVCADCGQRTGRTGMGAVLGAKNLKAMACRGTMDLFVKRPAAFLTYQKEIFDRLSYATSLPRTPITSKNNELTIQEITTNGYKRTDWSYEMALRHLIAESGLDLFSTRCMIEWTLRLFQKGIITQKDIRGIRLSRNNIASCIELVNRIVANKGIGTTLSMGPLRATKRLRRESLSCFPSVIEFIQIHTEAMANPLTPVQRDIYFPKVPENAHVKPYPIKTTGTCAADRSKNDSIGRRPIGTVPGWEVGEMVANCLGLSGFHILEEISGIPLFAVYEKLLDLIAGLGMKENDLYEIAERCYAVERLLNLRESQIDRLSSSKTDTLDVPVGLRMTKSSWNELQLKTFQLQVSRYYRQRGLDRKSMMKLKVFKNFGIDDLWAFVK
ncbi:MAG: aldehyde ferredoxin oxidoreductase N-terminal domain-containing protein, partial [Desulfobacterales bacterium]